MQEFLIEGYCSLASQSTVTRNMLLVEQLPSAQPIFIGLRILSVQVLNRYDIVFPYFICILANDGMLHTHRQLQAISLQKYFIRQNLLCRTVTDDLAICHQNRSVAGLQDHIQIMGGNDL